MSTTAHEQNHLLSEEQNQNHTNFVKNEKLEANESLIIQKDNPSPENVKKDHDEPKQNEQMPDQSGKSLTEKIDPDTQNEKLPESHSNPEPSQEIEQSLNIEPKEKEVTPKAHSEDKEKENVEKDDNHPATQNPEILHNEQKEATPKTQNLPVSQNSEEIQHDKKPDIENEHEVVHKDLGNEQEVKPDTNHPEPEIVHKDLENKQEVKPNDKHQENPLPEENKKPLDVENNDSQPQNQDESLENENEKEEKPLPNVASGDVAEAQKTPQEELAEQIGSVFNFFSVTKDNLVQSSNQAVAKLGDIISNSKLGSIVQGHQYTPVITSDHHVKTQESASSSARRRKSSQTDQTPKKATLPGKTPVGIDAKTLLVNDKSLSKLQSPSKQSDFKNKNEIEEQIRQHKIQEIIKQKKALEMKLGSLNEQLVELQKVELSSSPNRSKSKPKESREEFLERKKKATEFARKMKEEQKNIEIRNDQRREARQILVNKEIEALQQLADKKYERKKLMDFIKGQTEVVHKAKYGLSSLEEKKLELKQKREFEKDVDHSEHDTPHKLASKSSSKKLYKSPMLPQVLAHDAEVKKVESEKIQKRKTLHDKQVEYGRGVKDIFLPKVQSKFESRKLKMGVYKSQQVETHILRSGKDGLYGYLDRVKNELEGGNQHYKYKKKPMKQQQREEQARQQNDEDDDFDRPPADFADEEEQNVNVAYGKQLVYELQDNWNLADGTLSSRMMSNKNQQDLKKNLSPRNPDYTIKHKKEKELLIDGNHLSETEQSVHAKRTEPRYEDDEDY